VKGRLAGLYLHSRFERAFKALRDIIRRHGATPLNRFARRRAACLLLCAAWLAASADDSTQIDSAYIDGRVVSFALAPVGRGQRTVRVGPWRFGPRVENPKPRDKRLNLYLVAPGDQHHTAAAPEFDHNDVINALPADGAMVEWDVYWAIVLDPRTQQALHSERELLLLAQQRFLPNDLFEFDDAPGHVFLREFLKVQALPGLDRFRDRNRTLPRLLIVPAGFAVRAAAREREAAP
jgi:hypothetical protein